MEPIIQFSGADILGGDSVVIYGLDMAIPCAGSISATSVQKTYRCCAAAWASCSRISNC